MSTANRYNVPIRSRHLHRQVTGTGTVTDLRKQADMPDGTPVRFLRTSDWNAYVQAHHNVKRVRGKASECVFGCQATIYYWANLTENYADPYDYAPMCSRCHHRFDEAIASMTEGYIRHPGGRPHKLTAELVKECRARAAAGEPVRHIAAAIGVNEGTVLDAVRRRSWKWVA